MRLPEPLARPWKQSGAIISIGNSTIALFVGVIAFGFIGMVALLAAAAFLVAVELIRYSLNLEEERDAANARCDVLSLTVGGLEAGEADESTVRTDLEDKLTDAIGRLKSDNLSLERLQAILTQTGQATGEVLRHRTLADQGARQWPVIEMTLTASGYVKVTCDLQGSDGKVVEGEEMSLQSPDDSPHVEVHEIGSDTDTFSGQCFLGDLPPELESELQAYPVVNPNGYSIVLRGLSRSAYVRQSLENVEKLYQAMDNATKVVSEMLAETHLKASNIGG